MTERLDGGRPGFAPAARAAVLASDQRIVITGASGWLGSVIIELLHDLIGPAMFDRVRCFGSDARTLTLRGGLSIDQRPIRDIALLPPMPSIVFHLAFLTMDRVGEMPEDAYHATNLTISTTVRDSLDAIGATAIFVASSGAASFCDDPMARDPIRIYGWGKRYDEAMFAAWAAPRGRTAVIARLFNLAGAHINKHGAYAIADFALTALAGRAPQVRAPHRVMRSTSSVRELISLAFALLLGPPGIHRFETGGDVMELGEVAQAVADTLGAPRAVRAAITSDRIDRYVGDRTEYDRLRGQYGIEAVPLAQQIREMADYLVALRNSGA